MYGVRRAENFDWHRPAKEYWHLLYTMHKSHLDKDFAKELPNHFQQRLWELTMINFLENQKYNGLIDKGRAIIYFAQLKVGIIDARLDKIIRPG